jgi:hypothetical protein
MAMSMSCAVSKVLELFPGSKVLSGRECFASPLAKGLQDGRRYSADRGGARKRKRVRRSSSSLRVKSRSRTPEVDRGGALSRAMVQGGGPGGVCLSFLT